MNQRTVRTPGRVEPKQSLSRNNEVQACPGKATSFSSQDLSTEKIYCLLKEVENTDQLGEDTVFTMLREVTMAESHC